MATAILAKVAPARDVTNHNTSNCPTTLVVSHPDVDR